MLPCSAAVTVDALRSTVPVPVSVPSAPSNRPVRPVIVPVKLTSQTPVVVQVRSSAEPSKSTKSRSPFDALNVAVPENPVRRKVHALRVCRREQAAV